MSSRKLFSASLFACLLFHSVGAQQQCLVLNTIAGIAQMACPPTVSTCMKFTCNANGDTHIYKGCNDPNNPPVSCLNLLNNCMSQGGSGRCYTCMGDFCNGSSPPFSLFLCFFLSMLSLLSLS